MSLNHLVTGGQAPSQNVTVNDCTVEGNLLVSGQIQTSAFQSQTFDPAIIVGSTGTGQSLVSKKTCTAMRIGAQHTLSYECTFVSGTGAPGVRLTFETPIWLPDTTTVQDLKCVLNCYHLRGDGSYESLVQTGVAVGAPANAVIVDVQREDNANFPVDKNFTISAVFTLSFP